MDDLDAEGIATRQGSHAVHTLGFYKRKYNHNKCDFKSSYIADRLGILLPHFTNISVVEQNYVAEKIMELGDNISVKPTITETRPVKKRQRP